MLFTSPIRPIFCVLAITASAACLPNFDRFEVRDASVDVAEDAAEDAAQDAPEDTPVDVPMDVEVDAPQDGGPGSGTLRPLCDSTWISGECEGVEIDALTEETSIGSGDISIVAEAAGVALAHTHPSGFEQTSIRYRRYAWVGAQWNEVAQYETEDVFPMDLHGSSIESVRGARGTAYFAHQSDGAVRLTTWPTGSDPSVETVMNLTPQETEVGIAIATDGSLFVALLRPDGINLMRDTEGSWNQEFVDGAVAASLAPSISLVVNSPTTPVFTYTHVVGTYWSQPRRYIRTSDDWEQDTLDNNRPPSRRSGLAVQMSEDVQAFAYFDELDRSVQLRYQREDVTGEEPEVVVSFPLEEESEHPEFVLRMLRGPAGEDLIIAPVLRNTPGEENRYDLRLYVRRGPGLWDFETIAEEISVESVKCAFDAKIDPNGWLYVAYFDWDENRILIGRSNLSAP